MGTPLPIPGETSRLIWAEMVNEGITSRETDAANADAALQSQINAAKLTSARSLILYGNSMVVDPGLRCTAGLEYHNQVANALGTTAETFGVGGRRTNDIAAYMLSGLWSYASQGAHPLGAAATWAGMDTNQKFLILDTIVNDIGHYPDMTVNAVPALITGAGGTRYLDGMKAALRAVFALANSASRVENTTATTSGTWNTVATGSALSTSWTTVNGAYIQYTVTPAQAGPYAGDVWLIGYALSPEVGTNAAYQISVDGGAGVAGTTYTWEQYKGFGGPQVNSVATATKVTLPVDGNSHTIRITHNGSAGHILYSDAIVVPSANPFPIFYMGAEPAVKAGTAFDAAGAATWGRNWRTVTDAHKTIAAEFPNVFWVESSITPNGLSYVDGIHPNDRGMQQRANDLLAVMQERKRGFFDGVNSWQAPDSDYAAL